MGSVGVVVNSPFLNQSFGRWQIGKEVLVEILITQSPIEAFNKLILHHCTACKRSAAESGVPWCDIVPFHLALLLLFQDRIRGWFSAIVADYHAWITSPLSDGIKLSGNTKAR